MLLTVMGSGETSPTMVSVHQRIARELPAGASAVLLETPYGFQENVADISSRACQYFQRSVGLGVRTAPGLRGGDPADADHGLAMVRAADWLFCGPGSPTYALRWWAGSPLEQALHDRLRTRTGIMVFASAAAATLGRWTVPVYEIYKAGEPARWAAGLDVMRHLGLNVAVIPHYDNTEGGTHDTRFCYLGERRLRIMERELPDDAAVLGVDEHTAVHIDPLADTVQVTGRGGLTVRRHGASTVLPSGTTLTLTQLGALTRRGTATVVIPGPRAAPVAAAAPISEVAADCERRFAAAVADRDAETMARCVLELEACVHDWSGDTEEDDGAQQARAVLRTLIVRMGRACADGLADPVERLRPLVDPLVDLRTQFRLRRDFASADAVRTALARGDVVVRDGDDGSRWQLRS